MSLTMIVLFGLGLPVAAWLVAIGFESAARKAAASKFDWRYVDRRLLWTFILLDQLFIAALDWNSTGRVHWLLAVCLVLSTGVLASEIAKSWRTPGTGGEASQ